MAKLVEQKILGESSAETYEVAEELMGAVCYCIDETFKDGKNDVEGATDVIV